MNYFSLNAIQLPQQLAAMNKEPIWEISWLENETEHTNHDLLIELLFFLLLIMKTTFDFGYLVLCVG